MRRKRFRLPDFAFYQPNNGNDFETRSVKPCRDTECPTFLLAAAAGGAAAAGLPAASPSSAPAEPRVLRPPRPRP